MTRNIFHVFVFLASFMGMFWLIKDDAGRKTKGMRNPPRVMRQWAPGDSALVAFLVRGGDSLAVTALFNDSRFGVDDGVVTLFEASRRARKETEKQRRPYAWLFSDSSVAQGKLFLSQHAEFLDTVTQPFGVPSEVVAAMLRTESNFGAILGRHVVANALYTFARLAKDSIERNQELRELSALLVIMREKGIDSLFALRGSWRGAFGLSQFRPSSYLAYGVDGDKDGVVDLFTLPDAVASASNYLDVHNWSPLLRDQRKALYAYNRGAYADAVLSYATRIATD